jgi:transcriptional regulator with XRE-family HTH domain
MVTNNLGKILKQQRLMIPMTLNEVAEQAGVSSSHLGRIERGERFPSAIVLSKLAKPLGFDEMELFSAAGYLSPKDESQAGMEYRSPKLDPFVVRVLSEEPVEIQRTVIGIVSIIRSLASIKDRPE